MNKTDVTGETELENAKITITKAGSTEPVVEWVSKKGEVKEFILEDGEYTLTEKAAEGKEVTDGTNKYEVIESSVTFKVEGGKITSTTAKESIDKNATKGYVLVDKETSEITICDAKKVSDSSSSVSSVSGDSSSQVSKSTPSKTTPTTKVSGDDNDGDDKQSSSTTKKTTTTTTKKATTTTTTKKPPKKTTKLSGDDVDGDNGNGKNTTTTKAVPSGEDYDADDGDGTSPQTGHTGSTAAAAILLVAVAALAIMKKKDE